MTTLTVGTTPIDLRTPIVMTIINVTPDSFYSGSRTEQADTISARVREAVEAGAALLDVGGYSSRPGAADVAPEEEIRRLSLAMETIRRLYPDIPVSLDTFRAEVAESIIREYGPCIINDITAAEADPHMLPCAARLEVPYIAMHMRGMPQNMQQMTDYRDITAEVYDYFVRKIQQLQDAGIKQAIIDPGFGFSKTTDQNFELLAGMHKLTALDCPLLAGISRKSMIYKTLNTDPSDALTGTTALHWECLRQGASILRVHDTHEAVQVVRLWQKFRENS